MRGFEKLAVLQAKIYFDGLRLPSLQLPPPPNVTKEGWQNRSTEVLCSTTQRPTEPQRLGTFSVRYLQYSNQAKRLLIRVLIKVVPHKILFFFSLSLPK